MRSIRRRRLEGKTDYKSRFGLLKSGSPRLIIRKTNRYIIVQIVKSEIAQDSIILTVNSKDLITKGWPKEKAGSLKNLAAAYLTGFTVGTLALEHKIKSLILDIGMHRNIHKSRIYAVLKGALDSGLEIKHSPEALPTIEEIKKNQDFSDIVEKISGGEK